MFSPVISSPCHHFSIEAEIDREDKQMRTASVDRLTDMKSEDKVERLNTLLAKSIAYSDFIAAKIKQAGETGTVDVKDGAVAGTGLEQPALVKGEMRPYQLIGVHWLVGLYENGLNGILGDEMGLGKTVQSISMLAHLHGQGVHGPFLVVGPLSTLHNWANEFKKWTPDLEAVIYHGTKADRETLIAQHWRGKDKGSHMPVMITSYEIIIRDMPKLRKINWKFMVIDEGHRLKNMNCAYVLQLFFLCYLSPLSLSRSILPVSRWLLLFLTPSSQAVSSKI